jgi:hypothetical protein
MIWCSPLTDLSIVWLPSIRPVLNHLWSSASGLLLLSRSSSLSAMSHLSHTHQKINKHDSPHKINSSRTTEMSWIRIQIMACQWLIIIKPRYWSLGFSIFPYEYINNKKYKVWISNPRLLEAQLEDRKPKKLKMRGSSRKTNRLAWKATN